MENERGDYNIYLHLDNKSGPKKVDNKNCKRHKR